MNGKNYFWGRAWCCAFLLVFSLVFGDLLAQERRELDSNDRVEKIEKQEKAVKKKRFTYKFGKVFPNLVKMQRDGVVFSAPLAFAVFYVKAFFLSKKIKRGVYTFEQSAGMADVWKRLASGDEDVYALTIYEGNDIYDIDQMLLSKGIIRESYAFVDYVNKPLTKKLIMKKAGVPDWDTRNDLKNTEGFFYPDTYNVRASRAVQELIHLSVTQFRRQIASFLVDKKIDSGDWIKYLTIASLIEKETSLEREKRLISSVIFNRLRKRKRLEFCSSLIYMLKDLRMYYSPMRDGVVDIKKKHYPIPSHYNTYLKRGLPPSPIATPTFSSVRAALFPANSPYYFFVVRQKNKRELGHDFSETYAEHLKKIKKNLTR